MLARSKAIANLRSESMGVRNIGLKITKLATSIVVAHLSLAEPVLAEMTEDLLQFPPNYRGWKYEETGESINIAQGSDRATPDSDFLLEALEVADRIEDPLGKATVLSEIALQYAAIGETQRADEILSAAAAIADTLEDTADKARLLSAIALNYAAIDRTQRATDLLSAASDLANSIEDAQIQASLLTEIALKYDRLGLSDRSFELLSQGREVATRSQIAQSDALFPFEPTGWEGSVGISASLFSGAKTTSLATLEAGIERQWPTDEFDARLSLNNDYDDSRVLPENDNQFQGQIQGEYRHHFTARYQYFISSLLRRDEVDNINVRTNLYTGPGLNIWRAGPEQTLDMQLGLGVRFEDSNRRDEDLDVPVTQYRLRYKDIYFDLLRLRQFFTFELPFADWGDYYIESSTNLRIPIIQGWSFSNSLILRYSGRPTLENPNLRVDLSTGIEYEF